jgi:predicted metal-dependent HD superfamily phosphohydrolase
VNHTGLILDLSKRYCEPHRYYHTLEHIAYLLMKGKDQDLSDEQTLAIWFHDAIYNPQSRSNEADSADLAVEMLRACHYPEAGIELVRQIVLDSEQHEPTVPESAKVIDLDLCPLAAEPEIYDRNHGNIRRENSWLSDTEFQNNLQMFLQRFLARDRIFWTPWGEGLEAAARENLQRTLDSLR